MSTYVNPYPERFAIKQMCRRCLGVDRPGVEWRRAVDSCRRTECPLHAVRPPHGARQPTPPAAA